MGDIVNGVIRNILWGLAQAFMSLMDMCYSIITAIMSENFLGNEKIWTWYSIMCGAFCATFISFRLLKNYFKVLDNPEENSDLLDPLRIIKRTAVIAVVFMCAPFVLKELSDFVTQLVDKIGVIFGAAANGNPSDVMCVAGGAIDGCGGISDINEMADGVYKYFPSFSDFFIVFLGAIAGGIIMIMISISIGQRFIDMAGKVILAPWVLSSLVEKQSDTFSTWCKLFIADFLAMFMQVALLMVALQIPSLFTFNDNTIASAIFFLGALIGVLMSPSGVARLIGADVGVGQTLQSIGSISVMGHALGAGVGLIGSTISGATAAGVYGMGRLMGGKKYDRSLGFIGNGYSGGGDPPDSGEFGGGGSALPDDGSGSGDNPPAPPSANGGGFDAPAEASSPSIPQANDSGLGSPVPQRSFSNDYTSKGKRTVAAKIRITADGGGRMGRAFNNTLKGTYSWAAQRYKDPKTRNYTSDYVNRNLNSYSAFNNQGDKAYDDFYKS